MPLQKKKKGKEKKRKEKKEKRRKEKKGSSVYSSGETVKRIIPFNPSDGVTLSEAVSSAGFRSKAVRGAEVVRQDAVGGVVDVATDVFVGTFAASNCVRSSRSRDKVSPIRRMMLVIVSRCDNFIYLFIFCR